MNSDDPHQTPVAAWRQATLAGNMHFDLGEIGPARDCYERARRIAMHRFTRWPCADDAVAALVVSYLNLAEAVLRDGDLAEARYMTCALHQSLAEAADSAALTPALRTAAERHQRETLAALLRLQDKLGHCPRVAQLIGRAGEEHVAGNPTVH